MTVVVVWRCLTRAKDVSCHYEYYRTSTYTAYIEYMWLIGFVDQLLCNYLYRASYSNTLPPFSWTLLHTHGTRKQSSISVSNGPPQRRTYHVTAEHRCPLSGICCHWGLAEPVTRPGANRWRGKVVIHCDMKGYTCKWLLICFVSMETIICFAGNRYY